MSQQGERPTGHKDDWWGQLYDDSTEDTGPTAAPDSLDDRFASAAGTVGQGLAAGPGSSPRGTPPPPGGPPTVPARRTAATPDALRESPREAPLRTAPGPADPQGPATFPPGPRPPGFRTAAPPEGRAPTGAPVAAAPTGRTSGGAPGVTGADKAVPSPHDPRPGARGPLLVTRSPVAVAHVGSGPPTYDAEPTALPAADPDYLGDLVADTVLDGARYGACTLRAASVRGDSARYRGEPRRDSLLTARFGSGEEALVLVAMATGARATPGAHRAAAEVCEWIGRAVGRSHVRLAEDIRAARRGELKSGLHRLVDRSLGKLRASAAEQGVQPEEYTAGLRCLLLSADPACRTRVFFGVGAGGLFRLRDGEWQDIDPRVAAPAVAPVVGFGSLPHETPEGDRLTMELGIATPPRAYEPSPTLSASPPLVASLDRRNPHEQGGTPVAPLPEPFRFRASEARPGDTLLLCTAGLADPLRDEPQLSAHLTARWATGEPPGLAAFLADTQVRVKGYADDRTAAAVWEA